MKPENSLNFTPELAVELVHTAELAAQPPDIFEEYGNTEVTAFGLTASLKDFKQLAEDLCPVPPEQRTPEASAKFGAKLLQESGIELPDRYKHLLEAPQKAEQPTANEMKESSKQQVSKEATRKPDKKISQPEPSEVMVMQGEPDDKVIWRAEEVIKTAEVSEGKVNEPVSALEQLSVSEEANIFYSEQLKEQLHFQELQAAYMEIAQPAMAIKPDIQAAEWKLAISPEELVNEIYQVDRQFTENSEEPAPGVIVLPDVRLEDPPKMIIDMIDEASESMTERTAVITAEKAEIKVQTELITQDIEQRLDLPEEPKAQVEQTLAVLPEEVRAELLAAIEESSPEVIDTVESLVVQIAQAAARLHELVMTEQSETDEAIKIEELLLTWYEELCDQLKIEFNEEQFDKFITAIKNESFRSPWSTEADMIDEDAGTHEFKRRWWRTYDDAILAANQLRHYKIGRQAVMATIAA